MAYTISLLNMKGGVGKTTLAVNLAWYSYTHGRKKVLLIDFDPQFNASQYLMDYEQYEQHRKTRGTIADILIESPKLGLAASKRSPAPKKRITRLYGTSTHHFDFLPSELALAHVVKNPAQMDYRLEKVLATVRDEYDFVFIDCAPTDSVLTTMALTASNFFLVPVRPDRFSILGFGNLLQTVERFREGSNDPNNVSDLGVVFTQVRNSSPIEEECMTEVTAQAKKLGSHVFSSTLGFSSTFSRAIQNQTPAYETRYVRQELKSNITAIYKEMNARIAHLSSRPQKGRVV